MIASVFDRRVRLVSNRVLPVLLAITAIGILSACYERVVDARGIGTDSINVQKPYRSESALDKAMFPDNSFKDNGFESSGGSNNFDRTPK